MLKRLLGKIPFKFSKTWALTLVLSVVFFATAIPINQIMAANNSPKPAGEIYVYNRSVDSGKETGFLISLIKGGTGMLTGNYVETNAENLVDGGSVTAYHYEGGLLPYLAELGDKVYQTPQASAIIWAQDQYNTIMGNGKFVSFAYNANDVNQYYVSGFSALSPIVGMWNWSRNIVYGIFIVILVAIAFMIMFRQQLNGQQYITLTNSFPSITLSLVLITFSFPISAVFIDVVSIGCNIAYNLIINTPSSPGYSLIQDSYTVPKIEDGVVTIVPPTGGAGTPVATPNTAAAFIYSGDSVPLRNVLQADDPQMSIWSIFYTSNARICAWMPISTLSSSLQLTPNSENCQISKYTAPAAMHGAFSGIINMAVASLDKINVPSMLMEFIIILIILSTQFKLLKIIFEAYLILSFFPILSPWIFLLAAIPNRTQKAISDYVKILGGAAFNLITIYTCFLLLVVFGYSTVYTDAANQAVPNSLLGSQFKSTAELKWVPPMLGYSYGQIVGNSSIADANEKIIGTLIIVMFYLAIPRIPDEIRGWLEIPELPPILKGTAQDLGQKSQEAYKYSAAAYGKVAEKVAFGKGG